MNYVHLGNTSLELSNICLGGGNFGDSLSEEVVFKLLDGFVNAGGNFIDTANVYCRWLPGKGNCSEEIVGKWLKSRNAYKKMVVATKGGHYDLSTPQISRVTKKEIAKDIEESLTALRLEHIDFYWLHRDNEAIPIGEIMNWMEDFIALGKIRYYGASHFKLERMREAEEFRKQNNLQGFSAVSNRWSLAVKSNEAERDSTDVSMTDEFYQWHKETHMPSVPYSSTAGGFFEKIFLLNPKIENGRLVSPHDKKAAELRIRGAYINEKNLRVYNKLIKIREEYNVSLYTLSLAYMLSHPFNVIPVSSVNTLEQLDELIRASEMQLDFSHLKEIQMMNTTKEYVDSFTTPGSV